jgi:serine/threonine protein phosphatase PrpC
VSLAYHRSSHPPAAPRALRLEAIGLTDVGQKREHNEDAFAVHPDRGLLVLADGMGGHNGGDVASKMAIAALVETFAGSTWSPDVRISPLDAAHGLRAAIARANARIFTAAQQDAALNGMGTTIVAALTYSGRTVVAHVGDSRAYLLRGRTLRQLTEDHTVVNACRGKSMTDELREEYERYKHCLTRAVGVSEDVDADIRSFQPQPGDTLLLCSDGLTGVVSDDEITAVLRVAPSLDTAAELLIEAANGYGGPDNVTAIVARWST